MKNSGLFLNMAKWCFLGLFFFVGFNVKRVFWCVWYCFKRVKNACFFPSFLGVFLGWLIVVHLGLEGLGVFVSLVFVFVFLCCFCFCFVCFVLGLVVGCCCFVFFVFFLFFFVVWFFLFCFFGGFKGQVRWPEGPPHLALNPPYLYIFVVSFVLFFLLLFGCRVR